MWEKEKIKKEKSSKFHRKLKTLSFTASKFLENSSEKSEKKMNPVFEAPMISNPKYKGEWKAKKIPNPAYKGVWKPRDIPNPEYEADDKVHIFDEIAAVGFDLWQVKSGTNQGSDVPLFTYAKPRKFQFIPKKFPFLRPCQPNLALPRPPIHNFTQGTWKCHVRLSTHPRRGSVWSFSLSGSARQNM
eukprot:EG_transcript_19346